MSLLLVKLRRDLLHHRGQVIATALMMAAGIALFVAMRSMHGFLTESQREYYRAFNFGEIFASARRAPNSAARELAAIPGVARVEPRIVAEVIVEIAGSTDLVTARLVSIPTAARSQLNAIHLVRGEYPEPAHRSTVVASLAFARAHRLTVGDTIGAIINGRRQRLTVGGIGQSPEFIYEIRGGGAAFLPDPRHFGVLWVPEKTMEAAFDMEGGFNDVVLALERDASGDEVIAQVDRILEPWGGLGAYDRDDQLSHRFVSDEIDETQVTSILIPTIFIGVTAFMLYLITSRLIATQREQIALLKAFGFSTGRVVSHYAQFTLIIVGIGTVLGTALGLWFAKYLAGVYARFYQFPIARFRPDLGIVALTAVIAGIAALAGGLASVRAVLRLPPAESMRPPAPPKFRQGFLDRIRWFQRQDITTKIVIRNLTRRPIRAATTALGLAFGFSIVVVSWYAFDAIEQIKTVAFYEAQRSEFRVSFTDPMPAKVRAELARQPGVTAIEISRTVPVRIRAGSRVELVALTSMPEDAHLRRIVEPPDRLVSIPREGVVLTKLLAKKLGIEPGAEIEVESLEGLRRKTRFLVVETADELVGFAAYASPRLVSRFMNEAENATSAELAVDPTERKRTERALRSIPGIASVGMRSATLQSFDRTIAESFRISLVVLYGFACLIAVAIAYNTGRIALSERSRELASLRVLGFTRREVAATLLGEQGVIMVASLPLGAALGYLFCWLMTTRFSSESFRLPLAVSFRTFYWSGVVIVAAVAITSIFVRSQVNKLDLVAVLKARE